MVKDAPDGNIDHVTT